MNTKELKINVINTLNIQCLFFCIQSKEYQTWKRASSTYKIFSLKRIFN